MDKRTILFILLSVGIWFLYIQFVAPRFAPQPPPPTATREITGNNKPVPSAGEITTTHLPAGEAGKSILSLPEKSTALFQQSANITPRQKVLENNHIKVTLTNKGAAIESLILKQYNSARLFPSSQASGQLAIINTADSSKYALSIKYPDSADDLQNGLWEVITETSASVNFRYTTSRGLVIYKSFSLDKYNYALDFSVNLENISSATITPTLIIQGLETIPPESYDTSDITGLYAYTNPPVTDTIKNKGIKWYVEQPAPATMKKAMGKKNADSFTLVQGQDNIYWTGITNKYFASILVPSSINDINIYGFNVMDCPALTGDSTPYANLNFYLQTKGFVINPKETRNLNFLFYTGPKKASDLAVFSGLGFDKLLSYWWVGFISKTLLFILAGLFGLFKNYGVAVIVLTVIVKVIMFPITKKGQVSMYHLQKLQPRIKALQEQYKNDKRRFGEEQLKLFKEFGVNPLSGCLPMLLQFPVFIGLYWGLAQAIELRQSPFMLWITDLSQPDQLCKLPFPVLGAHYLHVLPLIMTVSWLIQSLTQPKAPDPQARQQQKMFLFMPLVFGIMFYSVPSGLTLYWFTSTLLGIVEQLLIKKYYFR
jgi:YidC/Oxa1 family membrane protein insertase